MLGRYLNIRTPSLARELGQAQRKPQYISRGSPSIGDQWKSINATCHKLLGSINLQHPDCCNLKYFNLQSNAKPSCNTAGSGEWDPSNLCYANTLHTGAQDLFIPISASINTRPKAIHLSDCGRMSWFNDLLGQQLPLDG